MTTDRARLAIACDLFLARVEPILKRTDPTDLPVNEAAADAEAQWVADFRDAIAATQGDVDTSALEDAIAAGDIDAAMAAVPWDKLEANLRDTWKASMAKLIAAGAEAAMPELYDASRILLHAPVAPHHGPRDGGPTEPGPAPITMRFDITNPRATAWAHTESATLVKQVSTETQDAIRGVIGLAFDNGVAPRQSAKEIRGLVGLLDTHAAAVQNARERDLANGLTQAQADKNAETYTAKLLKYRSENIARTETLRASAQGQLELWKQAREKGYLPKGVRRVWIAGQTERTCDTCSDLDGTEADLDGTFDDGIDTPPAHPSCRCSCSLATGSGDEAEDGDQPASDDQGDEAEPDDAEPDEEDDAPADSDDEEGDE